MIENFEQALEWLNSLQQFGIKMGLAQSRTLADLCGSPDKELRFIHLAGTNGKGSTGAMLERSLRECKYKMGFYSSPHLISVCERFRINGRAVSCEDFTQAAREVKKASDIMCAQGAMITYFEAATVMAMLIFKYHKCDYVIWETGMGGRLDATNIVTPEVCVITNIALDHEQYLGSDVASVAGEKAGIIKAGIPVVCGEMDTEASAVIRQRASEEGAPFYQAGSAYPISTAYSASMELGYQCFLCGNRIVELSLNGVMQQRNAQLAIAVLQVMGKWSIDCREGLRKTRWPGRIDTLSDGAFILDGGHNPDGIKALVEFLGKLFPKKKFHWVFGAFADKDFSGCLELIAPVADSLTAVQFAEGRRLSADPVEICRKAVELGMKDCSILPESLEKYLHRLRSEYVPGSLPVVIAGSLYLAGEVIQILEGPEWTAEL